MQCFPILNDDVVNKILTLMFLTMFEKKLKTSLVHIRKAFKKIKSLFGDFPKMSNPPLGISIFLREIFKNENK